MEVERGFDVIAGCDVDATDGCGVLEEPADTEGLVDGYGGAITEEAVGPGIASVS